MKIPEFWQKLQRRIRYAILTIILLSFSTLLLGIYYIFGYDNILDKGKDVYIYIPTGTTFDQLKSNLIEKKILKNVTTFNIVASILDLKDNVHPGRYKAPMQCSNFSLIYALRSGSQTPVNLTFGSVFTINDLATKLAGPLELESDSLLAILQNPDSTEKLGFDQENIISMFIPNTYQVYWNIKPNDLIQRFKKEYETFWKNNNRLEKAQSINLSPFEVSILASIVEGETYRESERPTIAGVYLNRLNTGMKLQADPTVIFAHQDFTITQVTLQHLRINSPYNTYKYTGLPPGPIRCPSISAIESVLNYEKHSYLYFCAKADFSGYHAFAKNYGEHLVNAQAYQSAFSEAMKNNSN